MKEIDSQIELDAEMTRWLEQFVQSKGRPLSVLHIGNIANNAYINAKIMRRIGIKADVICPDYYHIMGAPEWEDAEFHGDYGDPDFPNWDAVDLNGFVRPGWFIQGPRKSILNYYSAAAKGQRIRKLFYERSMNIGRSSLDGEYIKERNGIESFVIILVLRAASLAAVPIRVLRKIAWFMIVRVRRIPVLRKIARFLRKSFAGMGRVIGVWVDGDITARAEQLADMNGISHAYFNGYVVDAAKFRLMADMYDFVIVYATEGIYPMLAGINHYASYEHGTIRDIPFEGTDYGRACGLTYAKSPAVFITNTDCVAAADRLGIERERQYWIPHAFDTKKIFRFYNENIVSVTRNSSGYDFLAPARQHWKDGFATWRKGNDKVIYAAKLLNDEGIPLKIAFVEWGREVDDSKKLIAQLGIKHCFDWVPPMRKYELWKMYMGVKGVIDQFVMPAIGSVTFEAMALSRPVITLLDERMITEFFGEMPQIYNSEDPEGIASAMREIILYPEATERRGRLLQDWIRKYHSSECILNKQLEAIRDVLSLSTEHSKEPLL